MLFTITRDQYQKYRETAGPCRQYLLDKYSRLCEIVDVFNNYFGTEYVDVYGSGFKDKSLLLTLLEDHEESCRLVPRTIEEFLDDRLTMEREGIFSGLAIYVHWPSVIVTNERNQSVTVTDLYAKVPIYPNGRLVDRFTLSRATYPYVQYSSGYMHSHVSGINSDPSVFMRPCLGSGPLSRTQETLSARGHCEDMWELFCVELDRYVHVESIAGVPYRYLDRIGTGNSYPINYNGFKFQVFNKINNSNPKRRLFRQFFKYVIINKKMKFSFCQGYYSSAYNNTQWILKLSAQFLKFFAMMTSLNRTNVQLNSLLRDSLLISVKMNNGTLYNADSSGTNLVNYEAFRGLHVLWFKGEDIRTWVDSPVDYSENTYYILNPVLALVFLDQCLNYLNIYEHERAKETIKENSEVINGDSSDSLGGSEEESVHSSNTFGEKRVAVSI